MFNLLTKGLKFRQNTQIKKIKETFIFSLITWPSDDK